MAKAQAKTKEVAAAPKAGMLAKEALASWGTEGLDNSDILVSKMLLMQGLSALVASGEANVGQIRDSLDGTLYGGMVKPKEIKPVEVIVFSSFKTCLFFEPVNGKEEYRWTEPSTPENQAYGKTVNIDGIDYVPYQCLNFYVLRTEDIKNGRAFPYVVSFRSTSFFAGRKIVSIAAKCKQFKQPIASKVIGLSVISKENHKGKFFAFDVTTVRDSTSEEMAEAFKWYTDFKKKTVRVDDSDLRKEPAMAADSDEMEI